jgi:hypothetical protein
MKVVADVLSFLTNLGAPLLDLGNLSYNSFTELLKLNLAQKIFSIVLISCKLSIIGKNL